MQNGIISDHAIIPDINLGKHFYVSPKFHMLTKVRRSPDVAIFSHSGRVTDKAEFLPAGLIHIAVVIHKFGRASGRERVCQYVSISGVAVSYKKKKTQP